ncbi:hypothetical protein [Alicyclobacillus sp. SO9]|uniref:hypothetical protein n=1 Tax=Alicyclobacillus sp. SO9 TaxID=2665646 RepID=UPI0018E78EC1|nr:hypothetical protein [Alicyclobacillus sp. SO9]QQE79123.1 hypothetical protein GI364_00975 [Alicyclobacillus sp. SO9]
MTTSTWIEMVVLFVVLVTASYGRKKYSITRRFLIPIAVLSYFAFKYIKGIPTNGNNLIALIAFILMGAILGVIWSILTKIVQDDGGIYLHLGMGGVAVLLFAFLMRIIPIEWMTHHGLQTMHFAIKHEISIPNIIAPSFIFLTATMVLVRSVAIIIRVRLLSRNLMEYQK